MNKLKTNKKKFACYFEYDPLKQNNKIDEWIHHHLTCYEIRIASKFSLLLMIYFLPDSLYQQNTNPLNQSEFNGHLAVEKKKPKKLFFFSFVWSFSILLALIWMHTTDSYLESNFTMEFLLSKLFFTFFYSQSVDYDFILLFFYSVFILIPVLSCSYYVFHILMAREREQTERKQKNEIFIQNERNTTTTIKN